MSTDTVQAAVTAVVHRILRDTGRPTRPLDPADTFTGTLGLDSLDLAVLVVGLEQELQVDPFRAGAAPVQTVGELVSLYRQWMAGAAGSAGGGCEAEPAEGAPAKGAAESSTGKD